MHHSIVPSLVSCCLMLQFMAVGSSKGVLVVYENDPSMPIVTLAAHSP